MLSEPERSRFNALRNQKFEGVPLSASDADELAEFVRRIEEAEKASFAASSLRRCAENEEAEERIAALNALIEREEQFATRLRKTLDEIQEEHAALKAERQRIVASVVSC